MGTTGTGKFENYDAGKVEEDRCSKAFAAELEDVATCAFFKAHKALPATGTPVKVRVVQRVSVVSSDSDEEIGHLPTEFNYLRVCIKSGRTYDGAVRSSALRPLPKVSVDIAPAS